MEKTLVGWIKMEDALNTIAPTKREVDIQKALNEVKEHFRANRNILEQALGKQ